MASHTRRTVSILLATLLSLLVASAAAQDGVTADAASVSTASYALFPIDGGSDIIAQLQVAESAEGGARLVMTVAGGQPGNSYRGAIYRGDCGPDRELVLELAPTGLGGDPFVSSTETTDVSFGELTEGDHFVYLFRGDTIDDPDTFGLDGDALACGEVGAGANR